MSYKFSLALYLIIPSIFMSSKKKATVYLEKYTSKRKLGKGAFGDVFLVQDPLGTLFALKLINKKKMSGDN